MIKFKICTCSSDSIKISNSEVINGGDNQFFESGSLIMGKEDIYDVYKSAPNAKIISVHMEAVNHWTLSREELKGFIEEKGISAHVLVPEDGESYSFYSLKWTSYFREKR